MALSGSASAPALTAGRRPIGGAPFSRTPAVRKPSWHAASSSTGNETPRSRKAREHIHRLVGEKDADMKHWHLIGELDAVDSLLQEKTERARVAEHRAQEQAVLAQQKGHLRERRQEEIESNRYWGAKLHADAARFEEQERQKRLQRKQQMQEHTEAQGRHLQTILRARAEDQLASLRCDEIARDTNLEAQRRHEERQAKKAEEDQKLARERKQAYKDALQKRANQRRAEAAMDLAFQNMSEDMLAEQDKRRAEARMKQLERTKAAQAPVGGALLSGEAARLQREEAERARRYQQEAAEKAAAEQEAKAVLQARRKAEVSADIKQQREERKVKRAEEHAEGLRWRTKAEHDAQEAQQKERLSAVERKRKLLEHSEFLKGQMISRPTFGKFGCEQMNEAEKAMNRDMLDRASDMNSLELVFSCRRSSLRS